MKHALIILLSIFLYGCSSPQTATRALQESGYKNIQITGFKIFGCDKNDTFSTGFNAVGPTGIKVHGVVCSGFLKGSTIRLF